MRRPIIAANWKMNKLIPEAVQFVEALKKLSHPPVSGVEIVLAPAFTALAVVQPRLAGTGIQLAGQNMGWEIRGAFTGEVSAPMLKDAGCDFVILGHSERRKYAREDDILINQKISLARTQDLKVICCLGETLDQREENRTHEVVRSQMEKGLEGLAEPDLQGLVIAYEPVWAIGTGKNATPDQAQEIHQFIRGILERLFGKEVSAATRILYGGSVTPDNCSGLLRQADIDGALVGGASLEAESFYAIIHSVI